MEKMNRWMVRGMAKGLEIGNLMRRKMKETRGDGNTVSQLGWIVVVVVVLGVILFAFKDKIPTLIDTVFTKINEFFS